jgi:hypothetical protein
MADRVGGPAWRAQRLSMALSSGCERLSKPTVFRLKQDPQAALEAWGL